LSEILITLQHYRIMLPSLGMDQKLFDHEKLDVYCLELEFVEWVTDLLDDITASGMPYRGQLLDQLDRASLSALLNTAEGNGKRRGPQRAKFFDDARGSVIECAACLDASVAKRLVPKQRVRPGKEMLARMTAMLTRLVDLFDAHRGSSNSPSNSNSSSKRGPRKVRG
jgi:four helix bundle protein